MRMTYAAAIGAVIGAITLMSGCGTPPREAGDPLRGSCQFQPCVCADDGAPFWQEPDTVPIIWSRSSGVPACPLGFVLQRTEKK